ncbi:ANTAR domain-containing response regulator [Clostridium sp. 'White wine YQ']|uniref:ANTAR domain-containing response regulator n=1 Tax=Clostridium sp. 'White wine YQ' TaxID=3027474 RepID=UPI002366B62D|nr:ANTAR domain-containing protein [Clostridium sp. 'White wine YQ']MDD7796368.1 ANTAR domain-containing protein [Clostridium sp. 'White wine YQ']
MDFSRGIIIALGNLETAKKVELILKTEGHTVIGTCASGNELIRRTRLEYPSLIIVGYKLSDMTIMDVYDSLGEDCSFLAIVNEPYKSFVQEETDIYCISNPISKPVLLNAVDLIFQSQRRILKLRKKVEKLEHTIEDRKLIEKAKGMLMSSRGMSESEAFRYIQKNSMDSGQKMGDVAKAILNSEI